jgi:hypothetical protein
VRAVILDRIDEVLACEALSHEPAKNIGEGDNDGIDLSGLHLGTESLEVHAFKP